jgi:hypothetical protein
MQIIKQSTSTIVYVYLADSVDGSTPEVGVTSPAVYLSKNGGAAAVPESLAWAETDGTTMPGFYEVTLSAVDTNTVGPLAIDVFAAVAYVSAALLADIKTDTAAVLADTGTDGVVISTVTQDAIVDKAWDEALAGHVAVGTAGKALGTAIASADPWSADPASYAATDTFGGAIGRAIGGSGFTATTVNVQDGDDVNVEGVRVDAYSAASPSLATFITTGLTNSSGNVSFYLRAGTYYVFRFKPGYSWTDPVTLTVT